MNVNDGNAKVDSNSNSNSSGNSNDDDNNLSNELSNMNIDSSSSNRSCLHCLKKVEGSSRCSKCRTALYCSRECQLKHWPVHKNVCQNSNNTEDSNEKLEIKADNHLNQGNCMTIYAPKRSSLI